MLNRLLDDYHSKEIEDLIKEEASDLSFRNHFYKHRKTYEQLLDFVRNENTPEPILDSLVSMWSEEEFLKWALDQKFMDLVGEDYKKRINYKINQKLIPYMAPNKILDAWNEIINKKDLMYEKDISILKKFESEIKKVYQESSIWRSKFNLNTGSVKWTNCEVTKLFTSGPKIFSLNLIEEVIDCVLAKSGNCSVETGLLIYQKLDLQKLKESIVHKMNDKFVLGKSRVLTESEIEILRKAPELNDIKDLIDLYFKIT